MDAVTFAKEYLRMCGKFSNCEKCPILKTYFCTINAKEEKAQIDTEEVVRIVEEWSAAHPLKTHQSVFLEQYPNAKLDSEGIVCICPELVYGETACAKNCNMLCYGCRRKFWPQEVKE